MNILRPVTFAALFVLNAACGADAFREANSDDDGSGLDYVPFSNPRNCVITHSLEPEIRVCFEDQPDPETHKRLYDSTQEAVLAWFEVLRQIDNRVTDKVVESCSNPHLRIMEVIQGSGRAMAGCGYAKRLYTTSTYATIAHEGGHFLAGLSDTYNYDTAKAGDCVPGQPESLMCWGGYGPKKKERGSNILWEDDIKGIRTQFMNFVNQGVIVPTTSTPSLERGFLFLDRSNIESGITQIFISTSTLADNVYFCANSAEPICSASSPQAKKADYLGFIGTRKLFKTTISPNESARYSLAAYQAATATEIFHRSFRLTQLPNNTATNTISH